MADSVLEPILLKLNHLQVVQRALFERTSQSVHLYERLGLGIGEAFRIMF